MKGEGKKIWDKWRYRFVARTRRNFSSSELSVIGAEGGERSFREFSGDLKFSADRNRPAGERRGENKKMLDVLDSANE